MQSLKGFKGIAILVALTLAFSASAEEKEKLPNISSQVKKMMEKGKKKGDTKKSTKKKSGFTKADYALMQKAQQDLSKRLPDPGLKVGQKAPDFVLPDAYGKKVSLYSQLKNGPVILTFYRGAWCPFCNIELHALKQSMPWFKKYNAQVIAVTPQKPDKSLSQIKKAKYPFKILSDLDSKVMKAYKLYFRIDPALVVLYKKHGLDVESYNGKGRTVLPVPGTFVIDQKGIIQAAFSNVDYKVRMEPAAILAALKKL